MMITLQELQVYRNFDELANDVLDLAKEILPDKLIYLTAFSDGQQIILKLSDENTQILLSEGMVINLEETVCNRVDFERNQPLIFEDIKKEPCLDDLKEILEDVNIESYLGIPISLVSGERFGTLCAAHHEASHFDKKSVDLLQRIARMFSYYLELERLAYRDALTGLYNRQYLFRFFDALSKEGGVLFFLDLDGFKKVNDKYGHDAGDEVLKEVASKLQLFVEGENGAFAARLGGDEFIINFPGIFTKADLIKRAEKLLNSLNNWAAKYPLSASIGIVAYPANGYLALETLLKNADSAMYKAKGAGKNTYAIF
ncbi:sensor domain-containing diguanylate cyclase [Lysinibacillus yapensis]|uniref:Sensor domain-containing diguanylate cyclase n=1 Tax=Ureibacillus yapensis TaxID=2304605 RepID=A0A396S4Q9_9BACL|nr:sensor domain-containing diguanylate cyclase [Lysinibacillus yapensis]RHW33980.1 sensor domain-containing diguanylate cyclase [Lysinibacillus yapensis]